MIFVVGLIALGVGFVSWFLCSDYALYAPPKKEKRKNDEKDKNKATVLNYPTYDQLLEAQELERVMVIRRQQTELINLEYKQQEDKVAYINWHAQPQLFIEPNDDYRKTTL